MHPDPFFIQDKKLNTVKFTIFPEFLPFLIEIYISQIFNTSPLQYIYMPENILEVKGSSIQITKKDYISITDIARYKNRTSPRFVIQNWMRAISTVEFLGIWETIYNTNFKCVEFDTFRSQEGRIKLVEIDQFKYINSPLL